MEPHGNGFKLACSGREFYANCGIIGLRDDDDADNFGRVFFEGYDGSRRITPESWDTDPDDGQDWTAEEKAELANYMINLWQRWLDAPLPSQIRKDDTK